MNIRSNNALLRRVLEIEGARELDPIGWAFVVGLGIFFGCAFAL